MRWKVILHDCTFLLAGIRHGVLSLKLISDHTYPLHAYGCEEIFSTIVRLDHSFIISLRFSTKSSTWKFDPFCNRHTPFWCCRLYFSGAILFFILNDYTCSPLLPLSSTSRFRSRFNKWSNIYSGKDVAPLGYRISKPSAFQVRTIIRICSRCGPLRIIKKKKYAEIYTSWSVTAIF